MKDYYDNEVNPGLLEIIASDIEHLAKLLRGQPQRTAESSAPVKPSQGAGMPAVPPCKHPDVIMSGGIAENGSTLFDTTIPGKRIATVDSTARDDNSALIVADNAEDTKFDNDVVVGKGALLRGDNPRNTKVTNTTSYADSADYWKEQEQEQAHPRMEAANHKSGADMDEIRAAQTQNLYECRTCECCGSTPFPTVPISGIDASLIAVTINGQKNSAVADELAQLLKKGRKIRGIDSEKDWEDEVKAFLAVKLGVRFANNFEQVRDKLDILISFENQLRAVCD
jgi:hypothetical protein